MSVRLPLEVDDAILVRSLGAENDPCCESRVEGMSAGEMLIRWPTVAGSRFPIHDHHALTISVIRSQTVYEFEVKVLDKSEDPMPLLVVCPTSPVRTIQRRNDIRVGVSIPVELEAKVVGIDSFKRVHIGGQPIRALTSTVSGGGFAINYNESLPRGTHFSARLILSDSQQPLIANARVVHCGSLDAADGSGERFQIGFEFTRISEAARARIVRFVFGVQRVKRHAQE